MTLKAALKKRNMSALELIHRSGLSEQTVYNITSPNKEPYKTGVKTETLAKIAQMLGWVFVSCVLLATAIVLCALSISAEEDERSERECRKIKRVAHHTNEWRDAQ